MALRKRQGGAMEHREEENTGGKKPNKGNNLCLAIFMGAMLRLFWGITIIMILASIYAWAYSPILPLAIDHQLLPLYEGPLKINSNIGNGKKILEGHGYGPESTVIDKKGNLYTGYADGRIVKVAPSNNGEIGEGRRYVIADGGINVIDPIDESMSNGRPLGIRINEHIHMLYVVDAHYGLYALSLATRKKISLVAPDDVTPPMKFPNDLTITEKGNVIYFTDSSSDYTLERLGLEMLEGSCSGRIFKYDLTNEALDLISSGLCMVNGIQLVSNDTVLMFSESTRFRVSLLNLNNKRVIQKIYLPAIPDNIRPSHNRGRFWVSCCIRHTQMSKFIMSSEILRRILGSTSTQTIYKFFDIHFGLAVEIDEQGNIVSSIHDYNGSIAKAVSEVTITRNGGLILSSFFAPHLIKI